MLSQRRLLLAGSAVLAASVAVPVAGAKSAARPHMLVETKTPIRAFAQDSSRIAWVNEKWHVEARKLGPRAKAVLVGNAHPLPGGSMGVPPRLAVSGTRVVWTSTDGGNDFETGIYAREAGARAKTRLVSNTAADREERSGSYFGALAAGSSTVAFNTVDYECVDPNDCAELASQPSAIGGVFRLVGTARTEQVPGAPGSLELAVAAGRVALLPAPAVISATQIGEVTSPQLVQPGTPVQIRNATTGELISKFTPPGTVEALALTGSVAAVIDVLGDGTTTIERYDAATGAPLGSTGTIAVGDTLAASGNTFVFCVGGKIESMDATTGAQQVLAISRSPIGLSVVGRRVAWAVNAHGHGRILALTLP